MTEDEARAWVATHVSRETLARFETYETLIRKWQKAINLVSGPTLNALYSRHIADSLQIFDLRPGNTGHWVDIGSGAGFPGLICAIAAKDHAPDLRFTFIESDLRKGGFLREVARNTDVKITVLTERIEAAHPQDADVLSARALAPLTDLCAFADRHLHVAGTALFPKGRRHVEEQEIADSHWTMTREIVQSRTDPDAVIYRIGDLARA